MGFIFFGTRIVPASIYSSLSVRNKRNRVAKEMLIAPLAAPWPLELSIMKATTMNGQPWKCKNVEQQKQEMKPNVSEKIVDGILDISEKTGAS